MSENLETIDVGGLRLSVMVITDHDEKGGWWATTQGLMMTQGGPQPAVFSPVSEAEAVKALKKAVGEGLLSGVIQMIRDEASQN